MGRLFPILAGRLNLQFDFEKVRFPVAPKSLATINSGFRRRDASIIRYTPFGLQFGGIFCHRPLITDH
jgi:hypothetical protein